MKVIRKHAHVTSDAIGSSASISAYDSLSVDSGDAGGSVDLWLVIYRTTLAV